MAFEVTEKNAAALEPLFKPWEEPIRHRLPNPAKGGPAIIQPGRRPSKCPLVRGISADTALRLARLFGTTAEFWLGLQKDYELDVAMDELGDRLESEIRTYASLQHA